MYTLQPYCAWIALICAVSTILPCAAEYTQNNITVTPEFKLPSGVKTLPAPVSVAPDQNWQGIDGSWNGFSLRVGSSKARASVFPSTRIQQTWLIYEQACRVRETNTLDLNCQISRGYLFDNSTSSSWKEQGFYDLWAGKALDMNAVGLYGYDTVTLGMPGEEGPSVSNTLIATLVSSQFWQGRLGLHSKPTNFSQFEPAIPSYMTQLFEQGSIPSVSFGYTAGCKYRDPVFLASLTLGGYDSSRFIPNNNISFVFAPDTDRDLVVNVAGITTTTSNGSQVDLLSLKGLTMLIDSNVAELWLPVSVCEAFEKQFGLVYDNKTGMYLVNDTQHETLKEMNANITFTLGQPYTTKDTVQITLPYAAFDLEASPPYQLLTETTKYFPIRRSQDPSQWVLGRTFLQEAYLSVDWEREHFSIYPVDWRYSASAAIVPVVSPKYSEVSKGSTEDTGLSTGAIVGIAVGGGLAVILLVSGGVWWFWRRRRNAARAKYEAEAAAARKGSPSGTDEPPLTPSGDKAEGITVFPKAELPCNSPLHPSGAKEKDSFALHEADNTERPVYEMMGDVPTTPEAGGRQLSEKESMMVREKEINGIDPNSTSDLVAKPDAVQRPAPLLTLDDITMVNGRLPAIVSPVTPRTPRDGAQLEGSDTFFQSPAEVVQRGGRGLEAEGGLRSPISPMHPPHEERRRFSYES